MTGNAHNPRGLLIVCSKRLGGRELGVERRIRVRVLVIVGVLEGDYHAIAVSTGSVEARQRRALQVAAGGVVLIRVVRQGSGGSGGRNVVARKIEDIGGWKQFQT